MYNKVPDGVFFNQKMGRIVNHQGYATRIHWSKTMLDYLKSNFATTLNEDLSEWLGVSQRTMIRKARELGLQKDQEWLNEVWEQRRKQAQMVRRTKGNPGGFRKGAHACPECEFKPGHKPTQEEKERMSEGMKAYWRRHPIEAKQKAYKAWETRRIKNKQI